MIKHKEKPITRAEIRKIIRSEVAELFTELVKETNKRQSTKLENAMGFRYYPPEPEFNEDDPYGRESNENSNRKP